MKLNTNTWNKIRYTVHSLYYDIILLALKRERQKAIKLFDAQGNKKMLIVGAGTGLDLPYLNRELAITAIDLTPAMLRKLEYRADKLGMDVAVITMDGHHLAFEDDSFDYIVLNLILAVIPDPQQCMKEVDRVLKKGGSILVFDKFLKEGKSPSVFRRGLNLVAGTFFSEINRHFSEILSVSPHIRIKKKVASILNGTFMIYCLEKD